MAFNKLRGTRSRPRQYVGTPDPTPAPIDAPDDLTVTGIDPTPAPDTRTCEERAPGCIGFTNGCHCDSCMGNPTPAPSECRCPRDYDSQGDHHPDCPLDKPDPTPAPDDLVQRLEFHARQYASAAPFTEAYDLLKAAARIEADRKRIAELEETFDTLRGNAKYQQDRAERAEAEVARLTQEIAKMGEKLESHTLHRLVCNARHDQPIGGDMCICVPRNIRSLGADNAKLRACVEAADAMRRVAYYEKSANRIALAYDAVRAALGDKP